MPGVYVRGTWPESKKALKAAIQTAPETVRIVATSIYGGEHDGPIGTMPVGKTEYVVGPSPHNRRWYAQITRLATGGFLVK